jgi:hypothetical protein
MVTILTVLRYLTSHSAARGILVLGLIVLPGVTLAQTSVEPLPIAPGEPQIVALNGNGSPAWLIYEAAGGETITLTARSLEPEGAIDTVLELRRPDGRRRAYNDDHRTARDDLAASDSVLEAVDLRVAGMYSIRVDSYGSIGVGQVEVTLTVIDPFRAVIDEANGQMTVRADLPAGQPYRFTFEAAAGDALTITARDTSRTLDPRLTLLDAASTVIAANDDHASADWTLDALDARIAGVIIPADGAYTVVVADFLGRAGSFELIIAGVS